LAWRSLLSILGVSILEPVSNCLQPAEQGKHPES
jgi:hypothetical protein